MTFAASGDSLITRPIPPGHAGFKDVADYIKRAEARITNLEMVIFNYDCFASTYCGGTWLGARPVILKDIQGYGFNLYSMANNHTMDYSFDGLSSTKRYLKEAGLVHAGAGKDLEEASAPAFIDLPSGRVAIISIASTLADVALAGNRCETIPGRPGINPLRFTTEYIVTLEQYRTLDKITEETKMDGRAKISMSHGYIPNNPEGTLYFGGLLFRAGKQEGKVTKVNSVDMERMERSIQKAMLVADHVIISVHSHECKGSHDYEPDYFLEEFCRRCIDAGASGVVGTGTHQLRPIEIYKNRPIFYSLGNFIFQSQDPELLPADFNEKYGYPPGTTAREAIAMRSDNAKRGLYSMPINFISVIPYWEIEDGKMKCLELMPIDLGFGQPARLSGFPSKDTPEKVLEYLKPLCEQYGTVLKEENGLIVVDL